MLIVSSSTPENISSVINLPVIPMMKYQNLLWEIIVLSSVRLTVRYVSNSFLGIDLYTLVIGDYDESVCRL